MDGDALSLGMMMSVLLLGLAEFALTWTVLAPLFAFLACYTILYCAKTRSFRANISVWLTLAASALLTAAGVVCLIPLISELSLAAFLYCAALFAWGMVRLIPAGE